ncbi:MAG: glycosyltransferase [Candidatus Limnocylindria bacterium]
MRIALVASLVSPIRAAAANGPHAVILDLARGLTGLGHAATVYAAAGSEADGVELREIPVEPIVQEATVRPGGQPSAGATTALNRGFARLFEQIRRDRPEVVSQHAFDAAAIELAGDLPVLHTLHLPPIVPDVVAAARATRAPLATVSEAARVTWRAAAVRDVALLRNGVPDHEPVGGAVVPVALIAGRISPEKGTAIAIRVARRAGLAVLVVGDAYDAGYFASEVEPLLRPGEWIGAAPRWEVFELMARCAVLLMPIEWEEAFGLVAAEAQMAGCPVVAYRRGALPEVVPHRVGGWLVEPGDEEALVGAVYRARGLDRARIRARAMRELGVRRMVDAYHEALLHVAAHEPLVARAS